MSDLTVYTDVGVRFRDSDAMGHVNNAVYLTYLEVGREAYWKHLDPEQIYDAVPFVLARASIDFKHPARTGDTVRVGLKVHWMSQRAFGMRYRLTLREAGTLVAEAETVQVTYDYAAHASMPIPAWLRQKVLALEGPLPAHAKETS